MEVNVLKLITERSSVKSQGFHESERLFLYPVCDILIEGGECFAEKLQNRD